MDLRISLSEEDFRLLVAGGVVERSKTESWAFLADDHITVNVLLQDIGFDRMLAAVRDAQSKRE